MDLYLMRHASAVESQDWSGSDETRPLLNDGMDETRKVVLVLKRERVMAVAAIWSSPLVRARQTAEIASEILGAPLSEKSELACGARLAGLATAWTKFAVPDSLLLVGHEPDFGVLLAELLGEKEARPFKKAGVARLSGALKAGGMKLLWQVAPKDVV